VASEAQPIDGYSAQSVIPGLRGITLGQLAMRAAAGEKDVTGVVSRIARSLEKSPGVPAMMSIPPHKNQMSGAKPWR
jgi:hypothetical protein